MVKRNTGRRVVVAVALAALMVVGRAQPAGAFLSALDPAGWAVVAQMAAIISQAVAIKRQVENVRNQARAEFFGKLAPLNGKLSVVSGWLRNARSKAGVSVYNPGSSPALLPDTLPEFNRPMEECVGPPTLAPCMPPITSATLPVSTIGGLAATARTSVTEFANSSSYSGNAAPLNAAIARLEARGRADALLQQAAAERRQERRALRRSLIEEQMAVVEDWRGCQEAVPGAWNPPPATTDDRLPCMTNQGRGREDGSSGTDGTQGAQSDLVAKLDALERYQDGDISKVQLDTMQTQLIVMLGRIQAARAEREAVQLEEEQELRMAAEARRRRAIAVLNRDKQCQAQFGHQSYFIEDPPNETPPQGTCRQVNDVTQVALQAGADACLLPGLCGP